MAKSDMEGNMTSPIIGSGLICATMLAFGYDDVIPVSAAISELCNLAAVASGIVFFGLLDGE
jgi:hypothetical protein